MADNVAVTPGVGATIATDDVSGIQFQKNKIDMGGDGVSVPLVGDATYGLPMDVKRIAASAELTVKPKAAEVFPVSDNGTTLSVDDGAGSLTVDAPVASPVAVRLSTGSAFIDTIPVSGSVTGAQGAAAASSGAWPTKISDGTDTVGLSTVSGAKALKVDVIQSVNPASVVADKAAFVEGTGKIGLIGGEYQTAPSDPSDGFVGAVRITQKRALHVNLRADGGTEIGSSGAPIRTDPVGTTKQPVKLYDDSGTAYSEAAPVPVSISSKNRTRVTKTATLSASQTGTAIWTPTSGKAVVITKIILAITVAGPLTLFGGTNSEANLVLDGTQATGNRDIGFADFPWKATAINDVLKWTTGTGTVGVITIHGYEE